MISKPLDMDYALILITLITSGSKNRKNLRRYWSKMVYGMKSAALLQQRSNL